MELVERLMVCGTCRYRVDGKCTEQGKTRPTYFHCNIDAWDIDPRIPSKKWIPGHYEEDA